MEINRRDFLSYSALSGTAILFNEIAAYSKPLKSLMIMPGFELLILATNWGFEGTWDQFCSKVKPLGYDGAEAWYPGTEKRKEFLTAFETHKLQFGFLVGGSDRDPVKHLQLWSSPPARDWHFFPRLILSPQFYPPYTH